MNKNKIFIKKIVDKFKKIGVRKAGAAYCSGPEAEEIFKLKYKKIFWQSKRESK